MTISAPTALRARRLHPDAILPTRAHPGDAGLDLYAIESRRFSSVPCETVEIDTGIAVEIPEGWVGLVCPRSGMAREHGIGLTNAPGVIDAGYRGSIRVLLQGSTTHKVRVGDRIAQLVLVPAFVGGVIEVEELTEAPRGTGGFGSTGGFG